MTTNGLNSTAYTLLCLQYQQFILQQQALQQQQFQKEQKQKQLETLNEFQKNENKKLSVSSALQEQLRNEQQNTLLNCEQTTKKNEKDQFQTIIQQFHKQYQTLHFQPSTNKESTNNAQSPKMVVITNEQDIVDISKNTAIELTTNNNRNNNNDNIQNN